MRAAQRPSPAAVTGAGATGGGEAGSAAGVPGRAVAVGAAGKAAPGPVVVPGNAGAAAGGNAVLWIRFRSFRFLLSSATRVASAWRWRSLDRRSSALPGTAAPPLLSLSVSGLGLADCFLSSTDACTRPPLWRLFGSATGGVPTVEDASRCR